MLKNCIQKYGGGVNYLPPPPSMTCDTIYDRYFLSGTIHNITIKIYKTVLLNMLLKYINGTFSIQCDAIQDTPGSEQDILEVRYFTSKL